MVSDRLTIRLSASEMATIDRLSAALNISKSSVIKLAIAKLSDGNQSNEEVQKIAALSECISRSIRILAALHYKSEATTHEKVQAQIMEIWNHGK